MLVLVTVPIFFGLIVFFWVIGAMTAIFGKLLSMFDDKQRFNKTSKRA